MTIIRPYVAIFSTLIVAICLLFTSTDLFAAGTDYPTPELLKGGKVITTTEAKTLLDRGYTSIYDVRNPINYGKGRIPTAFSLPYKGQFEKTEAFVPGPDAFDTSRLPTNKIRPILFYSHGPTGWKSYLAAVVAINLGHKNVMWLRGGYSAWAESGYSVMRGR